MSGCNSTSWPLLQHQCPRSWSTPRSTLQPLRAPVAGGHASQVSWSSEPRSPDTTKGSSRAPVWSMDFRASAAIAVRFPWLVGASDRPPLIARATALPGQQPQVLCPAQAHLAPLPTCMCPSEGSSASLTSRGTPLSAAAHLRVPAQPNPPADRSLAPGRTVHRGARPGPGLLGVAAFSCRPQSFCRGATRRASGPAWCGSIPRASPAPPRAIASSGRRCRC